MARQAENWLPIANTLGFLTEREMFEDLYLKQEFSLSQLKGILGYSVWTIRNRLVRSGIPLRQRGGPNNRLGARRLKNLTLEELFQPAQKIVDKYHVHLSTVYAEVRFRKKEMRNAVLSNHANTGIQQIRK